MAYLIKNPPINHIKKVIVTDDAAVHAAVDDFHAEPASINDSSSDFEIKERQTLADNKLIADNDKEEITLIDGKLIYQDEVYFSETILEERVQEEMSAKKEELSAVREEHIQSGIEEGYKEGVRRANEEYQTAISDILKLFETTSQMYEGLVGKTEDMLKETIYMAICKSFGELLEHKNERINVIHNVIAEIKNTNPLKIKVSQADYQLIFNDENRELANNYNIEVDNRVEIGGCIVETDKGTFDGRLEVQLAKIREAVLA